MIFFFPGRVKKKGRKTRYFSFLFSYLIFIITTCLSRSLVAERITSGCHRVTWNWISSDPSTIRMQSTIGKEWTLHGTRRERESVCNHSEPISESLALASERASECAPFIPSNCQNSARLFFSLSGLGNAYDNQLETKRWITWVIGRDEARRRRWLLERFTLVARRRRRVCQFFVFFFFWTIVMLLLLLQLRLPLLFTVKWSRIVEYCSSSSSSSSSRSRSGVRVVVVVMMASTDQISHVWPAYNIGENTSREVVMRDNTRSLTHSLTHTLLASFFLSFSSRLPVPIQSVCCCCCCCLYCVSIPALLSFL